MWDLECSINAHLTQRSAIKMATTRIEIDAVIRELILPFWVDSSIILFASFITSDGTAFDKGPLWSGSLLEILK